MKNRFRFMIKLLAGAAVGSVIIRRLMKSKSTEVTEEAEYTDSCGLEEDRQSDEGAELLKYRFADREEGCRLLFANSDYYDGFTRNDLEYRLQKKNASLEEFKAFAREQVLDYTEAQKTLIDEYMGILRDRIMKAGYRLPTIDEIIFICTTMREECDVAAYTHGTQIYFSSSYLDYVIQKGEYEPNLMHLLAHEVFHCLSRMNPEFRRQMYEVIHFTVTDDEYKIPPSVEEFFISNPDVEHHNSYATFIIDDVPVDCFTAFVTTKHFEEEGDLFFTYAAVALVPIDGTDTYYYQEQASNFDEVFGANTGYVEDPEECLADNFSYLINFGFEGPAGAGYPNPEIIEKIAEILHQV